MPFQYTTKRAMLARERRVLYPRNTRNPRALVGVPPQIERRLAYNQKADGHDTTN